jgi:predicted amidophosphoribosyltransferase
MGAEEEAERKHLFCPYCDEEMLQAGLPYCQVCQITILYCPSCRTPLPRDKRVCPNCGAEIKGESASLDEED